MFRHFQRTSDVSIAKWDMEKDGSTYCDLNEVESETASMIISENMTIDFKSISGIRTTIWI